MSKPRKGGVDYKMDFYVKDFLATTAAWPGLAAGAYALSILVAWANGAELPEDPEAIRLALKYTPEEWARAWPLLAKKWKVVENGQRQHPRQRAELAVALARSEAGKLGNAKRWPGSQSASQKGSQKGSQSASQSASQKVSPDPGPRTSPSLLPNGVPISEGSPTQASPSPGIRGAPKAKKFSRPELTEIRAYWSEAKLRGDPARFFDHFESNGWRVSGKAPMKDWRAAARNWSRSEAERAEPRVVVHKNQGDLDREAEAAQIKANREAAYRPTLEDKLEAEREREYRARQAKKEKTT